MAGGRLRLTPGDLPPAGARVQPSWPRTKRRMPSSRPRRRPANRSKLPEKLVRGKNVPHELENGSLLHTGPVLLNPAQGPCSEAGASSAAAPWEGSGWRAAVRARGARHHVLQGVCSGACSASEHPGREQRTAHGRRARRPRAAAAHPAAHVLNAACLRDCMCVPAHAAAYSTPIPHCSPAPDTEKSCACRCEHHWH